MRLQSGKWSACWTRQLDLDTVSRGDRAGRGETAIMLRICSSCYTRALALPGPALDVTTKCALLTSIHWSAACTGGLSIQHLRAA